LLPELWVIGYGVFHIVVLILQYTCENQAKKQEPTFISSTRQSLISWFKLCDYDKVLICFRLCFRHVMV